MTAAFSLLRTAAAVVLMGLAIAADAQTQATLGELANLREEVVLSGAMVSGNRLDLNRFTDERSPHALLAEVEGNWSQRPSPIHRTAQDGWFRLTQLVGTAIEIFEVRTASTRAGAEGRRTRWRRGDAGLAEAGDWLEGALPQGSQVLDRIGHQDGGRRMTTVVAVTQAATRDASRHLVSALQRSGFRTLQRGAPSLDEVHGFDGSKGRGLALFLARGTEDIAVTISEHAQQRAIVMHWGRAQR